MKLHLTEITTNNHKRCRVVGEKSVTHDRQRADFQVQKSPVESIRKHVNPVENEWGLRVFGKEVSRVGHLKFPGSPGLDSALAWLYPLVKELRSCKLCSMAKKEKKEFRLKRVDGKGKDPAALCPSCRRGIRGLTAPSLGRLLGGWVGSVSRLRNSAFDSAFHTTGVWLTKCPTRVICLQGFCDDKDWKWLSTRWDSKQPERRLVFLDGMNVYCEVEEARWWSVQKGECV